MTIQTLLQGRGTLAQLDILQRADRLFTLAHRYRVGDMLYVRRYYGGVLTPQEITFLTPKLERS